MDTRAIVAGKIVFNLAWNRAVKYRALPRWARTSRNRSRILQVYIKSQVMNLKTKRRHEVDHIIPMWNKNVCGLHVPENLQILRKETNQEKSNYFVPYREKNGRKYLLAPLIPVEIPKITKKVVKKAKIAGKRNPTKKNPLKLMKKQLKMQVLGKKSLKKKR